MRAIGIVFLLGTMTASTSVEARSTGFTGYSGRDGLDCSICHSSGVAPTVTLVGPAELYVGATATFVLRMEGGQDVAGGLDVEVSDGALAVHPSELQTTAVVFGELVHTMPKLGPSPIEWSFEWTAPSTDGVVTMWGAGNSVNLDMDLFGDRPGTDVLMIDVLPCPDADADGFQRIDCNPRPEDGGGDCDDTTDLVRPNLDEICGDGLDNNCRLGVDEGCVPCTQGETRSCYSGSIETRGVGACADGIETCPGGFWDGVCEQDTTPTNEACNGVDDDCDGTVDGQIENCYTGPPETEGIGSCRGAQSVCTAGEWGACTHEITPSTERCNVWDDDCDGVADETCICVKGAVRSCYSGPPDTLGHGRCHAGFQRCTDGITWSECHGESTPQTDVCGDTIDQDCDGRDSVCPPGFSCQTTAGGGFQIVMFLALAVILHLLIGARSQRLKARRDASATADECDDR